MTSFFSIRLITNHKIVYIHYLECPTKVTLLVDCTIEMAKIVGEFLTAHCIYEKRKKKHRRDSFQLYFKSQKVCSSTHISPETVQCQGNEYVLVMEIKSRSFLRFLYYVVCVTAARALVNVL